MRTESWRVTYTGSLGRRSASLCLMIVSLRAGGSGGDARDNLIEVVAVERSPQPLLIVEDKELAGRALIEGFHRVRQRGLFAKELGRERVDEGLERLVG